MPALNQLMNAVIKPLSDPGQAARGGDWYQRPLAWLQSATLLGARLYVAQVFFQSGLSKLRDWSSTLALFQDEYHVPLLPPELAAYMGTAGELALPVLLVLGVFGRFAALGLLVVNLMAALSLEEIAPAALAGHQLWGVLLLVVALWGSGALSADAWWRRRLATRAA